MCSATQPALEEAQHPICQIGYGKDRRPFRKQIRDIVPFEESLWSVFKRTEIVDDKAEESEGIHDKAVDMLRRVDSVLIICNTRKEAGDLFEMFDQNLYKCFHLSAGMCVDHRRRILKSLYQALDERKEKVICVATQVIEAGVDISFGGVIRYCAGMDSIVQAAGRCNRNGENKKPGQVKIVRVLGENLRQLKYIEREKMRRLTCFRCFVIIRNVSKMI
jgi:CRISPR-associated endonuclease/helicase Cas3